MAAAYAVKRYNKQAQDEISFEVRKYGLKCLFRDFIPWARETSTCLLSLYSYLKWPNFISNKKNTTSRRLLATEKLDQKTTKSNSTSHKVQSLNKNEMFTVGSFCQSKQRNFLCRIWKHLKRFYQTPVSLCGHSYKNNICLDISLRQTSDVCRQISWLFLLPSLTKHLAIQYDQLSTNILPYKLLWNLEKKRLPALIERNISRTQPQSVQLLAW